MLWTDLYFRLKIYALIFFVVVSFALMVAAMLCEKRK